MKVRLSHPCGLSHPDGAAHYTTDQDVAVAIKWYAKDAHLTPAQVLVEVYDVPAAQAAAVHNVIKRQGADKLLTIDPPTTLCPWIGLTFEHTYVGVEPDGYAHS